MYLNLTNYNNNFLKKVGFFYNLLCLFVLYQKRWDHSKKFNFAFKLSQVVLYVKFLTTLLTINLLQNTITKKLSINDHKYYILS